MYAPRPGAQGDVPAWQTVAMPRTARHAPPQAEPRVRRGYFECRFGQLHVHNSMPPGGGFEEGMPLICLHGAGTSGRVFREFAVAVGRDRSVYAPDLPGCGESDPPPQPVAVSEYAAAISDFLDSVRLRHVDVLGQGAGAVVATELALTRPAQVRRLILASVPLAAGASHGVSSAADLGVAAQQYPLRERLGRLGQPLLVLRPKDEWWDAAAGVRSALPAARILDLPEQGADLFHSAPARVAEAVRGFLPA
jgi:pimeloyl-ACP methyl ester carboxylesterase